MTKEDIQKNSEHWYNKYKELEKENAELKEQNRKKEYQGENYLNKIDHKEEVIKTLQLKIERLEKENEELPTIVFQQGAEWYKKKADIQLTKAKELLNEFMRISKASDEDFEHDYSELIGETEQFIKDLEK